MSVRTLTLGHSPDPDDAFMFFALAEGRIDTGRWRFEHILADIQTLNERATRGELHISAISIHAYAYVLEKYALLPCGASMGDGYGPMLVAPAEAAAPGTSGGGCLAGEHGSGARVEPPTLEDDRLGDIQDWLRGKRLAIPGKMTSAWLALQLALGSDFEPLVVPFDQIFDAVKSGRADAGLLIHEGQLTYEQENMELLLDLGVWWKMKTGLPLPLGGNVIRKDLAPADRVEINAILRESIRYGLEHRAEGVAHALPLARGLDPELADQFIGMYVNDFTLDYGEEGRRAVREFLAEAHAARLIPAPVELEFVE